MMKQGHKEDGKEAQETRQKDKPRMNAIFKASFSKAIKGNILSLLYKVAKISRESKQVLGNLAILVFEVLQEIAYVSELARQKKEAKAPERSLERIENRREFDSPERKGKD